MVINAANAIQLKFQDLELLKVNTLALLGTGTSGLASTILFDRIMGSSNNGGKPLFKLGQGSVFIWTNSSVYVGVGYPRDGSTRHGALPGTNAIDMGSGTWDTTLLDNVVTGSYYIGININVASGKVVNNIWADASVFDLNAESGLKIRSAGAITNLWFHKSWLTSTDGHGVDVDCTGAVYADGLIFNDIFVQHSGKCNFRFIKAPTNTVLRGKGVGGNRLSSTNVAELEDASVYFSSSNRFTISGTFGMDSKKISELPGYANYGIVVTSDCQDYTIENVEVDVAKEGFLLKPHPDARTGRRVLGNRLTNGGEPSYATTSAITPPASGVAESNKTGMLWKVYISGGVVTDIKVAGVTIASNGPIQLDVPPGKSYQLTYTTAPKVVRQVMA